MRILVIANFPPYVLGGAENQVARLVDAWIDQGHHVEVAGHSIPNVDITRGKRHIRLHHISVFRHIGRPGTALTFFLSLIVLLIRRGSKFDIIYSRGLGDAVIAICFAKAIKLLDLPLVACPINAKGRGDANFIQSVPGWKFLVKLINRHCNAINIIAAEIKPDLEKIGIIVPNVTEIPNGIPILPYKKKTITEHRIKLIFTGRLCYQKGLDNLITALSLLRNKGYDFQCDLIGEGPLMEDLKVMVEQESLTKYISLPGSIPGEKIRNTLLEYDIFVLPSRYEGMSNSVLEAMEAGLPVVLTACGGIDCYIAPEHGWICQPDDIPDLYRALREMLECPSHVLESMGAPARLLIKNNFSIDSIAEQNIILMEKILSQDT